ncbi:hypothetical protein A1O3_00012 [Capronia epimyces CBS 606.96]|uniref:Uncharacterized protein n=1 Tax=Capronia epimyces CBS 606.96 TaxID=1182542 RepID=W9ZAC1_9EURO|nr:uncharacterized protein A1O3_00012 [Capronia epimyces CBS 606.96]EXJ91464.1 hypothetical protein A1O3_00012 [Capronia epimyces CBS 606.96]
MERDTRHSIVCDQSPLLQLLQETLAKDVDFEALEAILMSRLMRESNFRHTFKSKKAGFTKNGRSIKQLAYPWWVAQCIHYGLRFPWTKEDAIASIRARLSTKVLSRPAEMKALGKRLKIAQRRRARAQEQTVSGNTGSDVETQKEKDKK